MTERLRERGFTVFEFPADWELDDTRMQGRMVDAGISDSFAEAGLGPLVSVTMPILVAVAPPGRGMLDWERRGLQRVELWRATLPSRSKRTASRLNTVWTITAFGGRDDAIEAARFEKSATVTHRDSCSIVGMEGAVEPRTVPV